MPGLTDSTTATGAKAVLAATAPLFQNTDGTVTGTLDATAWDAMSAAMVAAGLLKTAQPASSSMTNAYMSLALTGESRGCRRERAVRPTY